MRFRNSKGEKKSRVPLRPTSSVHQTKVTGEKNGQQPANLAGIPLNLTLNDSFSFLLGTPQQIGVLIIYAYFKTCRTKTL